ncbi:ATP-binding cassette domain-containing protein [Kitasatospora sp. NBC_00085]|uniref:ABC transporter ATP-binding protein n=1 Tax=unclassified Kitasatospora TaxID=2633591 RepID=UPI003247588A
MLETRSLRAGYHGGTVLHGIDLTAGQFSVHAVLGPNGAGKTTLLHALAGLVPVGSGRIELAGTDVTRLPTHRRARAGIGLVPQGRRVFASLTVAEHLKVAHRRRPTAWSPARVVDLLPRLGERLHHRADRLSGGEQQMLAIARTLLTGPRVLLIDEPTEGLAPAVAADVLALAAQLAADGMAVVVTSPRPAQVLPIADRITVLGAGRITAALDGAAARRDPARVLAALTPPLRTPQELP